MNPLQKIYHRKLRSALLPEKNVTKKNAKNKTKNTPKKAKKIGEKNYHRVNCTLSKKEHEKLLIFSKSLKILPTKLFKNLAVSHLDNKKFFSPEGEKNLRGLVIEIRKIGININQIAKHTNTLQKVGFSDLRETHKKISDLEIVLHQAITFYSK